MLVVTENGTLFYIIVWNFFVLVPFFFFSFVNFANWPSVNSTVLAYINSAQYNSTLYKAIWETVPKVGKMNFPGERKNKEYVQISVFMFLIALSMIRQSWRAVGTIKLLLLALPLMIKLLVFNFFMCPLFFSFQLSAFYTRNSSTFGF